MALLIVLFIAVVLRFWQLGNVPIGVTHDELGYIYNAYSIATTGNNVFGEHLPFLTWLNVNGFPFLPVPIYLSVPFFWLLPLSAFAGRLPSALLGIGDVFLVYLLVMQVFRKKNLALLASLFVAVSPWHLHFSRSAYDPNFSVFFFLLGTVLFIAEVKKKRLPILSPIAMFFAIFSYRGMNAVFPPLTIVLLWYGITVLKMTRKQVIVFVLGILLVCVFLFTVIKLNGTRYVAEALSFNDVSTQESIDTQIREAQGPLLLRRMFLNKIMYTTGKLRENYIRGYSPEFLFLYTEPSKIYSIWSRGRIYFLDAPFIILGIYFLFSRYKKKALFVVSLLALGGIPGMIGGFPYSARNLFLSVIFPIFSAAGIIFLVELLRDYRFVKKIIVVVLIISYSYVIAGYLFDYYGRFAVYGAESWAKSLRDVSYYIDNEKKHYDHIVLGTTSYGDLMQYAFYAKLPAKSVQTAWQKRIKQENRYLYTLNGVSFSATCFGVINDDTFIPQAKVLYIAHDNCGKTLKSAVIVRDYAGNPIWQIFQQQ